MEAFIITIEGQDLSINPREDKDQILYEVYKEGLLCVVGLNEEAQWEANNNCDSELVQQIGDAIESRSE